MFGDIFCCHGKEGFATGTWWAETGAQQTILHAPKRTIEPPNIDNAEAEKGFNACPPLHPGGLACTRLWDFIKA